MARLMDVSDIREMAVQEILYNHDMLDFRPAST